MTLKEYYKEILNTLLSEDIETPLRNAEGEKAIKNLKGAARKSLDNWAIHRQSPHDRNHTSRGYKLQDKFVAVQKKLDARIALQQKEQESKTRYGLGGKIVKEDTQTSLRNAEGEKAIKNLKAKAAERMRIWVKVSDPHPHSPRAYEAGDLYSEARKKLDARIALQQKEQESKTRYGLGGKRRKTK